MNKVVAKPNHTGIKLRLNKTLYWDEDGYPVDTYSESEKHLKPQNLTFYHYNDLTEEEQEEADCICSDFGEPTTAFAIGYNRNNHIVLAVHWSQLYEDKSKGLYSAWRKNQKSVNDDCDDFALNGDDWNDRSEDYGGGPCLYED